MKVDKMFKLPKDWGTVITTDTPLPWGIYNKEVEIDGKKMIVCGVALEDDSSFMVKESFSSNIEGKEIKFID
ncbi:hypothetical protein A3O11_07710 [Ligilactobacillus aviarius]|uniref:hypothetical protein n=1 Tax=Ligilactobacillus aviarius TaxID=1606 RepID=UPI0007D8E273|nr:hypothetical protein [Ligilactobacillus aviarius]OAQ02430.1 hypothetical protein A3O11_07710 [Ligilactobacillus aviarius]OAQ02570.1 hypothetical protein A3O10_07295 [Ligilactobacillus aviarius]OAS81769.1 hypothetical protein A3O18_07800 [Ligilactobacillus aviarius]PEG70580.1 hypothetical protein A3P04_05635 [Ligilactobacillus aviarius]PEG73165.1 hypothetical protein A3O82_07790 [Ligilactobacillus aviarius]